MGSLEQFLDIFIYLFLFVCLFLVLYFCCWCFLDCGFCEAIMFIWSSMSDAFSHYYIFNNSKTLVILLSQDRALSIQWSQDIPWERHQICSIWFSGDLKWIWLSWFMLECAVCYMCVAIRCWCNCICVLIDQVFLFANSKCKRYFHNRLKPSKLTWTAMYRKQHKKVINIVIENIWFKVFYKFMLFGALPVIGLN